MPRSGCSKTQRAGCLLRPTSATSSESKACDDIGPGGMPADRHLSCDSFSRRFAVGHTEIVRPRTAASHSHHHNLMPVGMPL